MASRDFQTLLAESGIRKWRDSYLDYQSLSHALQRIDEDWEFLAASSEAGRAPSQRRHERRWREELGPFRGGGAGSINGGGVGDSVDLTESLLPGEDDGGRKGKGRRGGGPGKAPRRGKSRWSSSASASSKSSFSSASSRSSSSSRSSDIPADPVDAFRFLFYRELDRVETFYEEKLAEVEGLYDLVLSTGPGSTRGSSVAASSSRRGYEPPSSVQGHPSSRLFSDNPYQHHNSDCSASNPLGGGATGNLVRAVHNDDDNNNNNNSLNNNNTNNNNTNNNNTNEDANEEEEDAVVVAGRSQIGSSKFRRTRCSEDGNNPDLGPSRSLLAREPRGAPLSPGPRVRGRGHRVPRHGILSSRRLDAEFEQVSPSAVSQEALSMNGSDDPSSQRRQQSQPQLRLPTLAEDVEETTGAAPDVDGATADVDGATADGAVSERSAPFVGESPLGTPGRDIVVPRGRDDAAGLASSPRRQTGVLPDPTSPRQPSLLSRSAGPFGSGGLLAVDDDDDHDEADDHDDSQRGLLRDQQQHHHQQHHQYRGAGGGREAGVAEADSRAGSSDARHRSRDQARGHGRRVHYESSASLSRREADARVYRNLNVVVNLPPAEALDEEGTDTGARPSAAIAPTSAAAAAAAPPAAAAAAAAGPVDASGGETRGRHRPRPLRTGGGRNGNGILVGSGTATATATGSGNGDGTGTGIGTALAQRKLAFAAPQTPRLFAPTPERRGRGRDAEARLEESKEAALTHLYREMHALGNFTMLNFTGFHELLGSSRLPAAVAASLEEELETCPFVAAEDLRDLSRSLRQHFADLFCGGSTEAAEAVLLIKRGVDVNWRHVGLAVRLGVCITLLCWWMFDLVVDHNMHPTGYNVWGDAALPVWRGIGSCLLTMWGWCVVMIVWSSYRINYRYMLLLGPRAPGPRAVAEEASLLTILYLLLFIMYVKVRRGDLPDWVPAPYYPALALLGFCVKMFYPWRYRRGLWVSLGSIVSLPWGRVSLLTSVVADVLTSHVKVLRDLAYATAFICSGAFLADDPQREPDFAGSVAFSRVIVPILTVAPLMWRLLQNLKQYSITHSRFPFVVNAGKYCLNHIVVLFAALHSDLFSLDDAGSGLFVFFFACSTLYSFTWDVLVDWGLGRPNYRFLRRRLMYHNPYIYLAAILIDLVLRFAWTMTLIPTTTTEGVHATLSDYPWLKNAVIPLEILRRSMWLVFRLECEHLHNTFKFRDLDHVPLLFETPTSSSKRDTGRKSKLIVLLECAAFVFAVTGLAVLAAERNKF